MRKDANMPIRFYTGMYYVVWPEGDEMPSILKADIVDDEDPMSGFTIVLKAHNPFRRFRDVYIPRDAVVRELTGPEIVLYLKQGDVDLSAEQQPGDPDPWLGWNTKVPTEAGWYWYHHRVENADGVKWVTRAIKAEASRFASDDHRLMFLDGRSSFGPTERSYAFWRRIPDPPYTFLLMEYARVEREGEKQ